MIKKPDFIFNWITDPEERDLMKIKYPLLPEENFGYGIYDVGILPVVKNISAPSLINGGAIRLGVFGIPGEEIRFAIGIYPFGHSSICFSTQVEWWVMAVGVVGEFGIATPYGTATIIPAGEYWTRAACCFALCNHNPDFWEAYING
mgnify:CR=1 FL=1